MPRVGVDELMVPADGSDVDAVVGFAAGGDAVLLLQATGNANEKRNSAEAPLTIMVTSR
jgi:hypothetical protein